MNSPNSVRVERVGNRILLASDFPTPGVKDAIPGAYFRDGSDCWSVPLDLTTCHLLREKFGQRLVIGPDLAAWARAEKSQRRSQSATAAASDADLRLLPDLAPRLHLAMSSRTYQRAAVRFINDAHGRDGRKRTLVGDTVGLGKTVEAIAAVIESGQPGPYLVICPLGAVESTWAPEVRQWIGDLAEIVTLPSTKPKRQDVLADLVDRYRQEPGSLDRTWLIVHPAIIRTQTWWDCGLCGDETKYRAGMVRELDCEHPKERNTKVRQDHTFPQLFRMEYGAVIVDESDQILIRKTATPNLQRRGAEMLRDLVRPDGLRIAMSGTPFRSKPHQIWSTLNWLDPVRWSAKWSFLEKYWEVSKVGYGGSFSVGEMRDDREELLRGELSDVMIRRTREQVRGDLPAKIYPSNVQGRTDLTAGIYLPMTSAQERIYNEMEKLGEAELEAGTLTAVGALAEMTRLKQFAGAAGTLQYKSDGKPTFIPRAEGNKYGWIVEFLQQLGFPDRPASKLVIASQFTAMLNAFSTGVAAEFAVRRQPLPLALITGEVTGRDRKLTIDRFEDVDSDLDLLFINTKAGGSAITLDAADIMVVLDETWVDDEQQQLEGRIDNRNPERKIVPRSYYYLRSFGTIEEDIARRNAEARANGARLLDGAEVVKIGRNLLGERKNVFKGGPEGKIRKCRQCGVARSQWHIGTCNWNGDF